MQIQRYLLNNKIIAIANEQGIVTEYKPVYQRNITVYKGIDNKLQFKLLNQDQKPIDTSLYQPVIVVFDENNNQIIERSCTVLDDGSTSTKGQFEVEIFESELINIKQQYLSYNIYLRDIATGKAIITYSETNFRNGGVIQVSGDAFPGPNESIILTEDNGKLWYKDIDADIWRSQLVNAQPEINGNEALHSIAVYPGTFSGTVTLEGTLTEQIAIDQANANSLDWTELTTINFSNNQTQVANFNGIYDYLRVKTVDEPISKIDKIVIRN
jgi:hypothetical protein